MYTDKMLKDRVSFKVSTSLITFQIISYCALPFLALLVYPFFNVSIESPSLSLTLLVLQASIFVGFMYMFYKLYIDLPPLYLAFKNRHFPLVLNKQGLSCKLFEEEFGNELLEWNLIRSSSEINSGFLDTNSACWFQLNLKGKSTGTKRDLGLFAIDGNEIILRSSYLGWNQVSNQLDIAMCLRNNIE